MWIDRQDLLYSIRSAKRAPLLSIIAVVALALGIGLNAGVFTLLNALFLSPPTEKEPSNFIQIYPRYEGWFTGSAQYSSFTTEDFDAVRARAATLEEIAAWQRNSAILEQAHSGAGIPTLPVTCNYFHLFGMDRPLLGRFLTPGECSPGTAAQVVILSEALWRSRFDANPRIVGETIHLNGLPFTVVGIVPFAGVNFQAYGLYAPYTVEPLFDGGGLTHLANPDEPWLEIAGRLRPGYSRADAKAELTTILRQQDRAYVEHKVTSFNRKTSVILTNGSFIQNPSVGDVVTALMALILGPLLLVLLLACSNVTMLFLSRAVVRRGEMAVRLALGVGRLRLLRMLLLESFLTALVAGLVSIVLAYCVPQMIMNMANGEIADSVPFMRPNWHVFAYLATLVSLTTIASSIAPLHATWKLDLVTALKGREGTATMRSRLTGTLIVSQIAMSFVLLIAAVMFARMPGIVSAMDPGFETRQTLAVPLSIESQDRAAALSFYRDLEARIRAIPGVQSLAYKTLDPFHQTPPSEIRLPKQEKGQGKPATIDTVSTGFFSTFGIRMMAGRSFLSADSTSTYASSVAVVSQAFAKQFWPGVDPLGKIIVTSDDKRYMVIGVAADTRSERFGILDGPRLYTLRDPTALDGELYVRFTGRASAMEKSVFDVVKSLDRMQVMTPQTIWERLESNAENVRSLAHIIVVMASIAVLLAVTGVYAVLSFAVSQRTREFGIRMVLGANRIRVFRSILLRGGRQIAIGLACGIALAEPAAWGFARLIKNSPFPFRTFDASVFGIAAALLVAVSLAGMCLPALRATQVDPMKTLRTE